MTENSMVGTVQGRSALVFGWGAVERLAATWHAEAICQEVEPRLWHVHTPGGEFLGVIGKEPWSREELQRRAASVMRAILTAGGAP